MIQTYEVLKELKSSKRFTEGFNSTVTGCRCERCLVSRYRHISDPELMDTSHSFWDYLRFCISQVSVNGLWMEFGVGAGSTIDFIAGQSFGRTVIGFDSFDDYPEDFRLSDTLLLLADNTGLSGTIPPLKSRNVKLVRGYFKETLDDFLVRNAQPCAFVHIDCDHYDSTKYVLDTLHRHKKLVTGTVLLFDELYNYRFFEKHEFKAFIEFFQETGLKFSWIAHTASPVVWNGNQAAIVIG